MKELAELAGVLLIIQGGGGLLGNVGVDLFSSMFVVNNVAALDGYELYANIVLALLGIAVITAVEAHRRR